MYRWFFRRYVIKFVQNVQVHASRSPCHITFVTWNVTYHVINNQYFNNDNWFSANGVAKGAYNHAVQDHFMDTSAYNNGYNYDSHSFYAGNGGKMVEEPAPTQPTYRPTQSPTQSSNNRPMNNRPSMHQPSNNRPYQNPTPATPSYRPSQRPTQRPIQRPTQRPSYASNRPSGIPSGMPVPPHLRPNGQKVLKPVGMCFNFVIKLWFLTITVHTVTKHVISYSTKEI